MVNYQENNWAVQLAAPRSELRLLLLILVGLALLALPTISYPPDVDQGEFATLAQGFLRGQTLYTQIWNPKPPAAIFLFALVFASVGPSMTALRTVDLLFMLCVSWLLYLLGRRMYNGGVGLVAALGYGTAYMSYDYGNMAEPDGFLILPMVFAVYSAVRGRDQRDWRWFFASGAAVGLTFWLKYTALFIAPILLLCLLTAPLTWRSIVLRAACMAGGFLAASAPFLFYIISNGAWTEFFGSILVTGGYTNVGFGGTFAQAVERLVNGLFLFHIALWILAAFALISGLRNIRGGRLATLAASSGVLLWLWLLLTFLAVLIQDKFYPYQWLPMLAPLAPLAARGFALIVNWHGWEQVRTLAQLGPTRSHYLITGALLLAIALRGLREELPLYPQFLGYETGMIDQRTYDLNFGGAEDYPGRSALVRSDVAAYIATHTKPNDYIIAWGFEPELYYLSGRLPVSRFIYNYPVVSPWYPQSWQREFMAALNATPPTYFVVVNGDYSPFLSGHQEDSAGQLHYVPGLQQYLAQHYVLDTEIKNFSLYRHRLAVDGTKVAER